MTRRGRWEWYKPKKRPATAPAGYKPPSEVMIKTAGHNYSNEMLTSDFQKLVQHATRYAAKGTTVRRPWVKLRQIDVLLALMVQRELLAAKTAATVRSRLKTHFGILE